MGKTQIKRGKKKWRNRPGELVYTGDEPDGTLELDVMAYNPENGELIYGSELEDFSDYDGFRWISVKGLGDKSKMAEIGKVLAIDNLILEDIMHMGERPKAEFSNDHFFLVMKSLALEVDKISIRQDQVSFFLKGRTLVSFQDKDSEAISYAKERFKDADHSLRKKPIDYTLYYVMDLIVDNYFLIVSDIEEKIEEIEDSVMGGNQNINVEEIYKLRKELLLLRTSIWPLDDIGHSMIREESFIRDDTKSYIRDLKGNISQIMDYTSIYRESIMGLFDIYLSNNGNKMNQIMQTLTVISIMFIPSTFLAGVYGMNFKSFPEISFRYAYPVFWVVNVGVMIFMYRYFKNKRWL